MDVRVDELGDLAAGGAAPAGVPAATLPAEEILQEGQGQREGSAAVIFVEEEGVRHPGGVHHPGERALDLGIALHLRERHTCLQIV